MSFLNLNIEAFKAQMKRGARPNLFFVQMEAPAVLEALGVTIPDNRLEFFCKSAKLPNSATGTFDINYMGHKLPFAGDPEHSQDLPIEIINEEDFDIRNFFEKWIHLIAHPELGTQTTALVYEGKFRVTQLDGLGNPIKTVEFMHAFPNDDGEIGLNWDNRNQVETFTVNIKFSHHKPVNTIDFSVQGLVSATAGL